MKKLPCENLSKDMKSGLGKKNSSTQRLNVGSSREGLKSVIEPRAQKPRDRKKDGHKAEDEEPFLTRYN